MPFSLFFLKSLHKSWKMMKRLLKQAPCLLAWFTILLYFLCHAAAFLLLCYLLLTACIFAMLLLLVLAVILLLLVLCFACIACLYCCLEYVCIWTICCLLHSVWNICCIWTICLPFLDRSLLFLFLLFVNQEEQSSCDLQRGK